MKLPLQVYITFTDKCNLRCKHCYSSSGVSNKVIDIKRLKKIIDKINPLRILLSGGEPLLVYPEIEKFLDSLEKKPYTSLLTNGTLFDDKIKRFIMGNIDEVVISLDAISPRIYRKIRGKMLLNKVIENIPKFRKTGARIKINYTIFNDNMEEIAKIIDFMKKNKIGVLNILRQRSIGRSKQKVDVKKILGLYQKAINLCEKDKIGLEIHDPLLNMLKLKNYMSKCFAADKIISIDAELNFKPCPFIDLKMKGPFEKAWSSREFKSVRNKGICF
jgi:MoaA/NifB/PqqE/SkfB family radical SAM enzyme